MIALYALFFLALLPWSLLLTMCFCHREEGDIAVPLAIIACAAIVATLWSFNDTCDMIKKMSNEQHIEPTIKDSK